MTGTIGTALDEYESEDFSHAPKLHKAVQVARNKFDKALVYLKGLEDDNLVSYHSRRMVEMATDLIMSYLLLRDAKHSERKLKIAETVFFYRQRFEPFPAGITGNSRRLGVIGIANTQVGPAERKVNILGKPFNGVECLGK